MAILINDVAPRAQYTATGGQTSFTVPFEFFADADLKVYQTPAGNSPDDSADILTLTTNYSVTGAGVTGGGSITLVSGATAGDVITIERDMAVERQSDYATNGDMTAENINADLDKIVAMLLQVERNQELRSLLFQRAEQLSGVDLTLPKPAAGMLFGWDSLGTSLINYVADGQAALVSGLFTPDLTNLTTSATGYSDQRGYYAVIGNLVMIAINISFSSTHTIPAGNLYITGLPYDSDLTETIVSMAVDNMAVSQPTHAKIYSSIPNRLQLRIGGTDNDVLADTDLASQPRFSITGWYIKEQ